MSDQRDPSRLVPLLVLAGLILLGLAAWQGFPLVQAYIARQDCVALGRTNCG